MVRYCEIKPFARLRPFVDVFWILEHDDTNITPQRVVPDGRSELILNWRQPFESLNAGEWQGQPRCFFAGQIDSPLLLRAGRPARMLGVRFHPDGVAGVLGHPVNELSRRFTSVEDISPTLSRGLDDALEPPDPIAAVEQVLLAARATAGSADLVIGEAVRRMACEGNAPDVARLARELALSTRQLERRFLAAVGLPPRLFGRIQRFSRVLRAMEELDGTWVETAISCGYYDQAHLIRDCRSLAGTTPAVLLAEDTDLARHFYQRSRVSHSYKTG